MFEYLRELQTKNVLCSAYELDLNPFILKCEGTIPI